MPSLKDLKSRIGSVKSTRKITSAMKMVAASRLRRAQEQAEAGRPYAQAMRRIVSLLASGSMVGEDAPKLLAGTGKQETVLLIVISSDRGLCGAFNTYILREARRQISHFSNEGKQVKLICIGRKSRELLRRDYHASIIAHYEEVGKPKLGFAVAHTIAEKIIALFHEGVFDEAHLIYNHFKNVLVQVPTQQQIIPVAPELAPQSASAGNMDAALDYSFEPDEKAILADLLPRNVAVQLYGALLDSAAGEQGARMHAMDNATRNAGDMINRLSLQYNRARQAYITTEMIEIVTGAQAV